MRTNRSFLLFILACLSCVGVPGPARAQFNLELQTCEDLKITNAQYGVKVVETATCVNPTKTFKPKGTLRNVFVLATFTPVATGARITFLITKNDANGEYVQNMDYYASPQHTTAYIPFTINTPGKYFVRMANYYDKSQVWATTDFTVGEDMVGRALPRRGKRGRLSGIPSTSYSGFLCELMLVKAAPNEFFDEGLSGDLKLSGRFVQFLDHVFVKINSEVVERGHHLAVVRKIG